MQHKYGITTALVQQCAEKKVDIKREEMILAVMFELTCERRKAMEILKAVIMQFPYVEGEVDNDKGWVFNE